jgi:hypothetical protein
VSALLVVVDLCYCVGSTGIDEGCGVSYSGSFDNGDILKVHHVVDCDGNNCDDKYGSMEIM